MAVWSVIFQLGDVWLQFSSVACVSIWQQKQKAKEKFCKLTISLQFISMIIKFLLMLLTSSAWALNRRAALCFCWLISDHWQTSDRIDRIRLNLSLLYLIDSNYNISSVELFCSTCTWWYTRNWKAALKQFVLYKVLYKFKKKRLHIHALKITDRPLI